MKLTNRLQYLADEVADQDSFIDVAADHGYLALALAQQNEQRKIVVSDIAKLPLQSAIENFAGENIQADFRLGNGFSVLGDDEKLDVAIIAGIGGKLIVEILDAFPIRTQNIGKLVLSTNTGMHNVRSWARRNHYIIDKETVIEENGKFYEFVTLVPGSKQNAIDETNDITTELAILFGADIQDRLEEPYYREWLTFRLGLMKEQIKQMSGAKTADVESEIERLRELCQNVEELLNGKN